MDKTENLCMNKDFGDSHLDRKTSGRTFKREPSLRASGSKQVTPTRNPFINFLRDFRREHKGFSPTEVVARGAELWRNMTEKDKNPYCVQAKQAPAKRRKGKRHDRNRRRRRRKGQSSNDSD